MNINEPRHGGGFVLPFFNDSRKQRGAGSGRESLRSTPVGALRWIPDTVSYICRPLRKAERWFNSHTKIRNHFVATSAEFAGTTLFLFFAFSGTQVALLATPSSSANVEGTPSDPSQLLYIALAFGFSLAVNAWVFFRISGGLFNPAVTLGMCLVGALPYKRGLFLFIAQILGGITAAAIVSCLFPGPVTFRTSLAGGTSITQGLFIEMFLTAELVFTIFMLAAEKHKGTFIAPIGIGLSLFIAELTGVYFTGGSVNPARSFGPSVVAHSFHGYHWIYWIGPFLGAILASGFYKFIKMLEYETANPGQDDGKTGEAFDPSSHPHNRVSFDESAMGEVGKDLNTAGGKKLDANGLRVDTAGHGGMVNGEHGVQGKDYGTPTECGSDRRAFSDSPAPPHPNDQFTGLDEGGMHANETVNSPASENTLVGAGGNGGVGGGNEVGVRGGDGAMAQGIQKSVLRTPGNKSSGMPGNLRDDTYNNQRIGQGQNEQHEEFYNK